MMQDRERQNKGLVRVDTGREAEGHFESDVGSGSPQGASLNSGRWGASLYDFNCTLGL